MNTRVLPSDASVSVISQRLTDVSQIKSYKDIDAALTRKEDPYGALRAHAAAGGSLTKFQREALADAPKPGTGFGAALAALPPRREVSVDEIPKLSEMRLQDIDLYDHNPRLSENPVYQDLKASIKATGFAGSLTVTRRPGSTRYMVARGGNTTLAVLRDLYDETKEERFNRLNTIFVPWTTESAVLVNHLLENEARADITFWEKATALNNLRVMWESEGGGKSLSLRAFEARLKAAGMNASLANLMFYTFAIETLSTLGAKAQELSRNDARTLQPLYQSLHSLATKSGVSPEDFHQNIIHKVNRQVAESASVAPIVNQLSEGWVIAMGVELRDSPEWQEYDFVTSSMVNTALELMKQFPNIRISEIKHQIPPGGKARKPRTSRATEATPEATKPSEASKPAISPEAILEEAKARLPLILRDLCESAGISTDSPQEWMAAPLGVYMEPMGERSQIAPQFWFLADFVGRPANELMPAASQWLTEPPLTNRFSATEVSAAVHRFNPSLLSEFFRVIALMRQHAPEWFEHTV